MLQRRTDLKAARLIYLTIMTLEEYLKSNYKEEIALPYDKWLISQVDFNGNGKVDSGKIYRTNNRGRKVWTGSYYKEDNAYKRLQNDPSTYAKWEAYKETIIAANNQKLRQLKAIWETSQSFENGTATAEDLFKADNGIVTRYQQDQQALQTNNYIKYALIALVIIGGIVLISKSKGKGK